LQGFSTYEEAAFRKYNQLVKQVKPEMDEYEEKKKKVGDAFYADAGTLVHGSHVDTKDAIERLAKDVEQQVSFAFGFNVCHGERRVARFFLVQHTEAGKNIPNYHKYTTCP
jgi:hypothetical protein